MVELGEEVERGKAEETGRESVQVAPESGTGPSSFETSKVCPIHSRLSFSSCHFDRSSYIVEYSHAAQSAYLCTSAASPPSSFPDQLFCPVFTVRTAASTMTSRWSKDSALWRTDPD